MPIDVANITRVTDRKGRRRSEGPLTRYKQSVREVEKVRKKVKK